VLVLHDIEGVPAAEIARIVDVPLLTVRTRLFYARKELYAALARDPELAHLDAAMRDLDGGGR
jgi:RNA polymerase sigma-70 factor (ECF subfamily)